MWQTFTYRDAQVHTGGSASPAKPSANSKLILFPNEGWVPGGTSRLPPHSAFSTCVFFSFLRGFYFFLPLATAPWQFYPANSSRQQMLCTPRNNLFCRPALWNKSEQLSCCQCRGAELLHAAGAWICLNPIDLSRRWLNVWLDFWGKL